MRASLTALGLVLLLLGAPAAGVSLDLAGSQLGPHAVDDLSGPGAIRIDPDLFGSRPPVFRFVLDDEDPDDVLTLNLAVDLLGDSPWVGFELFLGPGVSFLSVGDVMPLVAPLQSASQATPDSALVVFGGPEPAGFDVGDPFGLGLSDWRIDRSGLAAGEAFTLILQGQVPEPRPAFLLALGAAALFLARARQRRLLLAPLLALSLSCTPEPFAVQPALAELTSPVVVGHRGALHLCPENTLPCYELALQLGAAALEADLQVLGDGTLVMLHDENTDSVSGVDLEIADIDLATLRTLDAGFEFTPDGGLTHPYRGQGLRVLTLAEFLEALPDVPVLLDVKPETPEMEAALLDFAANDLLDRDRGRLYIKSNDEPVAEALRRIDPTPTVSLSDDERTNLVVPVALGVPTPFDDFAPTWIDLPAFALLDGLTAAWSRPRGHLLTVSTIDPPDEIDALLSAGNADGIVTNRPDLAHFLSGRAPSPTPGDGPFPCADLEAAIASRALARDGAFDAGLDLFRLQRRYDDNCVTLAQIQVVGTHNSYHQRPHPDLLAALGTESPLDAFSWDYAHAPIPEQLERLGVRQLELDVFADPEGGLFADPFGRRLVGEPPPADPALLAPGFKVLHQQDVDFETSCSTLVACLAQVRDFSDANPRHLPIFVQLELKDGPPNAFEEEAAPTVPFDDPALFDALEAEILSVLSRERLITPDDVRGDAASLEAAVLAGAWPTLGESRGRIVLLLDNEGPRRDLYVADHPSLAGRLLFAPSPPGTPEAAFLKRNDPFADAAEIRERVAEGYLVRTRADSSTVEARFGQRRRRNLAFASGAQIVSTDYPEPDPVRTDYRVRIPGPAVARCNPLTAPPACRQAGLAVDPGMPSF